MPLSTVIREKRKELGLTQEQIAERLGVSTPAGGWPLHCGI